MTDNKKETPITTSTPTPTPVAPPAPKPQTRAPKKQEPGVGRIVHYYTTAGEQRAALITAVDGASVRLMVFNDIGAFPLGDVAEAPFPTPECWSWPERN